MATQTTIDLLKTANSLFSTINDVYFNNSIGDYSVSISSKDNMIRSNINYETELIELSYRVFELPTEEIVAKMIHEACHLYALQNGIKDCSGVYHNSRYKKIAEELGHLKVERHDKYGWSITLPSDDTLKFCENFPYSFNNYIKGYNTCVENTSHGMAQNNHNSKNRKPSSTRKYQCPYCGNSFRATKDINVLCMDCDVQFIKVN